METPPVASTHAIYVPGMSIFSPVIPDSVRRAIPRVLRGSTSKTLGSDSPSTKERQGLKDFLGHRDKMTSASAPDLFSYSQTADWSTTELPRPTTAISDDSDSASGMSSTVVDPSSMELARLDDFAGSGADRFEMDSGVRWNRVLPGSCYIFPLLCGLVTACTV